MSDSAPYVSFAIIRVLFRGVTVRLYKSGTGDPTPTVVCENPIVYA